MDEAGVVRAWALRLTILSLGWVLSVCAPAMAATIQPSDVMALGGTTVAPPGYVAFCRRLPERCASASPEAEVPGAAGPLLHPSSAPGVRGEPAFDWSTVFKPAAGAEAPTPRPAASLPMTPELWRTLEETDRDINRRIIPTTDRVAFGREDYWALPLTEGIGRLGNCKHYVLEKWVALQAKGVPESAMSIAIVTTPAGEVHAVLVVETDKGEYVLDNLSPWVTPWRKAGYTWLVRQAPGNPNHWVKVVAG